MQDVNSPLDVIVNGKAAEVVNKIGWPDASDTYSVDFRVPERDGSRDGVNSIERGLDCRS